MKTIDKSNTLIQEVKNYLDILETPRPEYSGLPTCPFVKKERINDNLFIDVFDNTKSTFLDKMSCFIDSKYTDAVFAQKIEGEFSSKVSKDYQAFLNSIVDEHFNKYKIIVINPNDDFSVKGFKPRSLAPCVLILVTEAEKLIKSHNKMLNSQYFANFDKEYLDHLLVQDEEINLK